MRRLRKIIIILLLLLVGGAIVNVAVAWGCGLWWIDGPGVTTKGLSQWIQGTHLSYSHSDSAGWPARSLSWQPNTMPFKTTWAESLNANWEQEPLPLKPIWLGFAINTIFYAGVLWMMLAFPFVIRRRSRIKRGLCPACAYPTRGGTSPVCTECGGTVQPRRGAGM